jgi:hypothetical protein
MVGAIVSIDVYFSGSVSIFVFESEITRARFVAQNCSVWLERLPLNLKHLKFILRL